MSDAFFVSEEIMINFLSNKSTSCKQCALAREDFLYIKRAPKMRCSFHVCAF